MLDTEIQIDPARNLVMLSWGPIRAEVPYREALALQRRLDRALDQLRSVEYGPTRKGGDGIFRDVTDVPSSANAS
jgi:hypothetical protein